MCDAGGITRGFQDLWQRVIPAPGTDRDGWNREREDKKIEEEGGERLNGRACWSRFLSPLSWSQRRFYGGFLLKDRLFPPALSHRKGEGQRRLAVGGRPTIGDLIPVFLEIEGSAAWTRGCPFPPRIQRPELLKRRTGDQARKGGWRRRTRYLFTAWRTGDYRLTADNITYYTVDGERPRWLWDRWS